MMINGMLKELKSVPASTSIRLVFEVMCIAFLIFSFVRIVHVSRTVLLSETKYTRMHTSSSKCLFDHETRRTKALGSRTDERAWQGRGVGV